MASFTKYGSYGLDQSQTYDCTGMPNTHTKTPSTKGWWNCCQCHREVDPETHGYNCPQCTDHHAKCNTCTTNNDATTPSNDQLDFEASTHSHHRHFYHGRALLVSDMPNPGYEYTRPDQPMNTFWQCCQCSEQINSEWGGTECTNCNHYKCTDCSDVVS